ILRVKASASRARLRARWNFEVAISSMVRVILRMFWIALRRLTRARVLAMAIYLLPFELSFLFRRAVASVSVPARLPEQNRRRWASKPFRKRYLVSPI